MAFRLERERIQQDQKDPWAVTVRFYVEKIDNTVRDIDKKDFVEVNYPISNWTRIRQTVLVQNEKIGV